MNSIQAKPVTPTAAKNVAVSFYKQHSIKEPQTLTLAYTESALTGEALYYVFNVNTNDGFVIVTADDATHPIIGYSTENVFVVPEGNTNISYWMNSRKKEILSIKATNVQASADIAREWTGDFSANNLTQRANGANSVSTASVAPLVKTTWNQSPYYNALCPATSGTLSVTGCVATTMAQIMKYWSYPAHGIGSSSYCDCTASGFKNNYGTLSANYAATTYSWSAMPVNVSSANSAVATLMYQCGVSVHMNYDPDGSSSYVLSVDAAGGACAQTSYTAYFGYDQTTIHGYQRTQGHYTDAAWLNLIESDLNIGRPVQYAGQDTVAGGHTWVCDGYDVNNNLHMNWGWGGYDNGYFSINNLATTNGNPGFNPEKDHEILVGIQPPPSKPSSSFTGPSSTCATQSIPFTDASTGSPTGWHWDVKPTTGVSINTYSIANPYITFNNAGTYTVTEAVTNNLGSDSTSFVVTVTTCTSIPCDTATHIGKTDTLLIYTTGTSTACVNNGYFTGTNCYGFTGLAESYAMTDFPAGSIQVNGAIILFYRKTTTIGTHGVSTHTATTLSMVNGSTNPAATAAASTAITFSNIAAATGVNNIGYAGTPNLGYSSPLIVPYVATFASPVSLTSNFFLSLTLPATSGDTLAVFSGKNGHNAKNTAWVDYGGTWYQFSSLGQPDYALAILPIVSCQLNNTTGINNNNHLAANINVFPNPNNGTFTFAVSLTESTNLNFIVNNTLGQIVYIQTENNISNGLLTCNLSGLLKGIYYATITDSNNNKTVKKIIIE